MHIEGSLAIQKRREQQEYFRGPAQIMVAVLPRGAVFCDTDRDETDGPERLWFFRGTVGDGTGRLLSQRLFVIREAEDGQFAPSGPLRLHNLRPRTDAGSSPPALEDLDARKRAATVFCLETLVPKFVEDVAGPAPSVGPPALAHPWASAGGRLKELAMKERYLERSFRVIISRHADRLLDMEAKSSAGQDMNLALLREQRLLEEAKLRQQKRLEEIRQEQQLVPRVPEFLGVAAVVPVRVVAGRARAPDLLVATVAEAEARQGRRLQDVRSEELYYDAVSQSDDGVDIRYLVAREVDAGGDVWLTATEWAQLAHLGDAALLYVASDGGLGAITAAAVRQVAVEQQDRRCRLHLMAAVEPSRSTHATDGPV